MRHRVPGATRQNDILLIQVMKTQPRHFRRARQPSDHHVDRPIAQQADKVMVRPVSTDSVRSGRM